MQLGCYYPVVSCLNDSVWKSPDIVIVVTLKLVVVVIVIIVINRFL